MQLCQKSPKMRAKGTVDYDNTGVTETSVAEPFLQWFGDTAAQFAQ